MDESCGGQGHVGSVGSVSTRRLEWGMSQLGRSHMGFDWRVCLARPVDWLSGLGDGPISICMYI
jgi:hypothetical protein